MKFYARLIIHDEFNTKSLELNIVTDINHRRAVLCSYSYRLPAITVLVVGVCMYTCARIITINISL